MDKGIQIHFVTDQCWAHTHGMAARGLPELEIRDVPASRARGSAAVLKDLCDPMLRSGSRVRAGETMHSSGATFRFVEPEPMPGNEEHYEVERLQVVAVEPARDPCNRNGFGGGHHEFPM